MSVCPELQKGSQPRTFLVQACQHLWFTPHDDVYQQFPCLGHTIQSGAPSALMLAEQKSLR
jgi:hypothetical protein